MVDLERIAMSPDAGGAGAQDQNARLLQMLQRGKWLIVVLPILFAGVTWAYYNNQIPGFKVVPLYRATGKIQVDARIPDPIKGSTQPDSRPSSLAKQQEQLFRSPLILQRLADMEEVANLRIFQNLGGQTVMGALYEGLMARSDAKTDRVAVSFTTSNRNAARLVTDAAIQAFLDYHKQFAYDRAMNSVAVLEGERTKKQEKIAALDVQIRELKKEHGISGDVLRNPFTSELEALKAERQTALQDMTAAQVELQGIELKAKDPVTFLDYGTARRNEQTTGAFEERIAQYKRSFDDLTARRLSMAKALAEGHEQLLLIDRERAALQKEIDAIYLTYAEEGLRIARDKVQSHRQKYERYQELVAEIETKYFAMEGVLTDLHNLVSDRQLLQNDVNQFTDLIAELHVSGGAGGLNIHVVEPARTAPMAVYPETMKYVLIAGALGFALSVGLVLLRGFADRRIWTVEEVPNLLGTDVVGVFPELFTRKRPKVGRIVEEDPGSIAAESIRSLRTSCSFGLPENGKGIVFVTSSVSGEGKSVVASNLAIAFAQSGRKTLLLDADLRSPGQNEIFAVIGKRGFGDALAGDGDYESGLVRSVTAEGLDMLPAGDSSKGAAELVEGGGSRELMARLRQDYDCIVIDSSPVLETSETRVLASMSDLVVFVMRMNVSTAPNGQRAVGILRNVGAELLGVMLNGARTRKGAKAYAGGLTYGYGYGYGQYKKSTATRIEMQEVASRAIPTPGTPRFPTVGDAKI